MLSECCCDALLRRDDEARRPGLIAGFYSGKPSSTLTLSSGQPMDDVAPALAVASSDGVSNPKLKETLEVMRRLRAKKAPTAPYEINAESLYRQAEAIFAMREKLAAKDWDAAGEAVEFALDLLGPEEEAPATDPTAFEARTKVSKTEHETRKILRRECVAVRAALDRRTIGLVMERALSHGRLSGYVGAVEVGDISDGQLEKACATCERLARRSDLAANATERGVPSMSRRA